MDPSSARWTVYTGQMMPSPDVMAWKGFNGSVQREMDRVYGANDAIARCHGLERIQWIDQSGESCLCRGFSLSRILYMSSSKRHGRSQLSHSTQHCARANGSTSSKR